MGRRARTDASRGRREARRDDYGKVLIVCEGEKTEPNYLKGIREQLRLNNANVEIIGEGATPSIIVERASELIKEARDKGDPFDRVFCVFDQNGHTDYEKAVKKAGDRAIPSVPCFEYWLLLHYKYTTRSYVGTGEKSACDRVTRDLKKYLAGYTKSDKHIFRKLQDKVETAKRHAARSLAAADKTETDNPSTRVHILVDYLQHLKD